MKRLASAGFMLNLCKSHFGVTETKILGHLWKSGGYFEPEKEKLKQLSNMSDQELAHYGHPQLYGLLNWYRTYLPDFTTASEPLRQLLSWT